MAQLIKVAETKEIPPGTAKAVDVEGRAVALLGRLSLRLCRPQPG